MRCFPAVLLCLLLTVSVSYADVPDLDTHHQVIVLPVSPPVNPPPEYLLTPPVPAGSGPAWRTAQEDALREAAFRYLFTAFSASAARQYHVVYLSLSYYPGGQGAEASQDPNLLFLRHFSGNLPPVQPVSALPASSKDWHDQRKHHWIIYRVSSFRWTNDAHVEINCGDTMSGYISSDSVYLGCTLRKGWWTITGITYLSA